MEAQGESEIQYLRKLFVLTKGTNTNICANTNIQQTDFISNNNHRSSFADSDSDTSDNDKCDIETSDSKTLTNDNCVNKTIANDKNKY